MHLRTRWRSLWPISRSRRVSWSKIAPWLHWSVCWWSTGAIAAGGSAPGGARGVIVSSRVIFPRLRAAGRLGEGDQAPHYLGEAEHVGLVTVPSSYSGLWWQHITDVVPLSCELFLMTQMSATSGKPTTWPSGLKGMVHTGGCQPNFPQDRAPQTIPLYNSTLSAAHEDEAVPVQRDLRVIGCRTELGHPRSQSEIIRWLNV